MGMHTHTISHIHSHICPYIPSKAHFFPHLPRTQLTFMSINSNTHTITRSYDHTPQPSCVSQHQVHIWKNSSISRPLDDWKAEAWTHFLFFQILQQPTRTVLANWCLKKCREHFLCRVKWIAGKLECLWEWQCGCNIELAVKRTQDRGTQG